MKGFQRDVPIFSLCGLKCGLCPMFVGKYCPGCGGGEGNRSCMLARCSIAHGGIQFCHTCSEYPCTHYAAQDPYDSFLPYRNRQTDIDHFRSVGQEAFLAELREKMRMLETLLTGYNDGRRKRLFCVAAYLLETEDLRAVMNALEEADTPAHAVKERAALAKRLLEDTAGQRGIVLRLYRKECKKETSPKSGSVGTD